MRLDIAGGGGVPLGRLGRGVPKRAASVSWGAVDMAVFAAVYVGVGVTAVAWVSAIAGPAAGPAGGGAAARIIFAGAKLSAVGVILIVVWVRRGRVGELGWRRTSLVWLWAALPLA